MNIVKKVVLLTVFILNISCEADTKTTLYEKNGVKLTLVDGWTFSGDSDFYWAADRAVSAETQLFSAMSVLIYYKDNRNLNEINLSTIINKVLPKYIREIEEGLVVNHQKKSVNYGTHSGTLLKYESSIDVTDVFLFELQVTDAKVFVLFITDKEDFQFVESTIEMMLDGIAIGK